MQTLPFDKALASRLGDPKEVVYTPDNRQQAMAGAVRAYSQYRPLMRRVGTGNAYDNLPVGATSLLLTGGPYSPDDVLRVGMGAAAETVTVDSVAIADKAVLWKAGSAVEVTIKTALTGAHSAGTLVRRQTPGIGLIAGEDTYLLPVDFLKPDVSSFDMAVGNKLSYRKGEGYYDGAYQMARQFASAGYGARQNYGVGRMGLNINGSASPSPVASPVGEVIYRFLSGAPPILMVIPAPTVAVNLDFYYRAQATLADIPDADMEACLHYAMFAAQSARAAKMGGEIDFSEDDVHESGSANANALEKLAQDNLAQWNKMIVGRPVIMSG